jgi:C-terminal processing protease CtpA/Prc
MEAPRRGQLGLIVKSSSRNGTSVYAVKDYSPLFGEVCVGDRIIEVDGKDTTHSSLVEIKKLLNKSKKSSSFMKGGGSGHGGNLRIVVSRRVGIEAKLIPSTRQDVNTLTSEHSHQREGSYGSDASASTLREDVHYSDSEKPNEYVLL